VSRKIHSDANADTLGPYSHGAVGGGLVFTAGQIPVTPDGEVLHDDHIGVQTEQSLANIERILAEEGLTMDDICKTTVYMTDIDQFDGMNEVYHTFFEDAPPARTALEVQRIADDASIEIEAVAAAGGD
jgi:reactive intermediate/imine deaminase